MAYRVPVPLLDCNRDAHGEWGYLIDVKGGWQGRAATEAEWRASASAPEGRGQFWGDFGRLKYVDTPKYPEPAEAALFTRVRKFKARDDTRGGYVPVVIGWCDKGGRCYCINHAPRPDTVMNVITCDNSAAKGCRCSRPGCGASILAAAAEHEAQRKPFPSTCPAEGDAS